MENESKICKNCSAEIIGEYCHVCGQRYHAHKESFGELAFEFVSDFLHFDSKFFRTALPLLFIPGKLTQQYNDGKQKSQFHPIRLYLFCSFIYFLIFFALNDPAKEVSHAIKDSKTVAKASDTIAENKQDESREFVAIRSSKTNFAITIPRDIDSMVKRNITPEAYLYDQKLKPRGERDGWFQRMMTVRLLEVNAEGEIGKQNFILEVLEGFLHNIPKMLFILLPVFALYLKLLYIRRKKYYYVDHATLSLHYFSFIFLLLSICSFGLDRLFNSSIFTGIALLWIITYLYLAMNRIYHQGWFKTLVKFLVLGALFVATLGILTLVNFAWSAVM